MSEDREVIGIRVDANDTVGMGHIMRCITIAKQLKQRDNRIVFFAADEYVRELLEGAGMEWICLHTQWNHMEEEILLLREKLKKAGCGKLLVDSYQVGAKYFDKLRDLCKLIYIDDCFEEIYPVDLLINYNAYWVRFPYKETYRKKTKLLLGTSYVPLREEFQKRGDAEENTLRVMDRRKEMQHVLLSSGGADVYNVLAGILAKAVKDDELAHIVFHTIVGRFNNHGEQLERLAESYSNIRLHREVNNMAELMKQCKAAVSAAGTVLFELSAMQVPAVFFVCADNQEYDSEFFAREERMLFAGDIRTDRQGCIDEICSGLKRILRDGDMRRRMKEALHKVTDGRGAERIAEAIRKLC